MKPEAPSGLGRTTGRTQTHGIMDGEPSAKRVRFSDQVEVKQIPPESETEVSTQDTVVLDDADRMVAEPAGAAAPPINPGAAALTAVAAIAPNMLRMGTVLDLAPLDTRASTWAHGRYCGLLEAAPRALEALGPETDIDSKSFWEHVGRYAKLVNGPAIRAPKRRKERERERMSRTPRTRWGQKLRYDRRMPAVRAVLLFMLVAALPPYLCDVYAKRAAELEEEEEREDRPPHWECNAETMDQRAHDYDTLDVDPTGIEIASLPEMLEALDGIEMPL